MDVFFVLSGFLITSLLLGELSKTATLNLRDFYARRALRLLPALLAVIVFAMVAVLTINALLSQRLDTLFDIPAILFFVGNWLIVFSGHPYHLGILGQTWSLSVEEQFYLIWPLTLLAVTRRFSRTRIAYGLLCLTGVEWVVRLVLEITGVDYTRIYYSTLLHSDGLLVGVALALLASERKLPARVVTSKRMPLITMAVITAMMLAGNGTHGLGWVLMTPVAVLATALVVASITSGSATPIGQLLASKPLVWIGKRSYGIYLWHATIIWTVQSTEFYRTHPYPADAVAVVATFAAATASYSLIERPALKLKERRFSRTEAMPTALQDGRDFDVSPEV